MLKDPPSAAVDEGASLAEAEDLAQHTRTFEKALSAAFLQKTSLVFMESDDPGDFDGLQLDISDAGTAYFRDTMHGLRHLKRTLEAVDVMSDDRRKLVGRVKARLEEFTEFEESERGEQTQRQKLLREVAAVFGQDSAEDLASGPYNCTLASFILIVQSGPKGKAPTSRRQPHMSLNIIQYSSLFIVTALCFLCHLNDRQSEFVLEALRTLVAITMLVAQAPAAVRNATISHFPRTLGDSSSIFDISGVFVYWIVCPDCSTCYFPEPPQDGDGVRPYCTARTREGDECGAALFQPWRLGLKTTKRPVRLFPVQSIGHWIENLMQMAEFEELIDRPQVAENRPNGEIGDAWHAEYLFTFRGPDLKPFAGRQGNIMLALSVDWLNPFGNLTAKKKFSIGAIYLTCLNLPLSIRYLLANACILAVMPGTEEPDFIEVHRFWRVIVEQLNRLWRIGYWLRTNKFPLGRTLVIAVGPLIGDMPAIKKILGLTDATSTSPCHFCSIHRSCLDIFCFNLIKRLQRTKLTHLEALAALRAASNETERDKITTSTGVRESAFNDLEYFDPTLQAGLDQMHMFARLCENHFRGAFNCCDQFPSSIPPLAVPDWPMNSVSDLYVGEQTMLEGSIGSLEQLGVPVLQELCWRRGINWYREKAPMARDLDQWVSCLPLLFN